MLPFPSTWVRKKSTVAARQIQPSSFYSLSNSKNMCCLPTAFLTYFMQYAIYSRSHLLCVIHVHIRNQPFCLRFTCPEVTNVCTASVHRTLHSLHTSCLMGMLSFAVVGCQTVVRARASELQIHSAGDEHLRRRRWQMCFC